MYSPGIWMKEVEWSFSSVSRDQFWIILILEHLIHLNNPPQKANAPKKTHLSTNQSLITRKKSQCFSSINIKATEKKRSLVNIPQDPGEPHPPPSTLPASLWYLSFLLESLGRNFGKKNLHSWCNMFTLLKTNIISPLKVPSCSNCPPKNNN